MKKLHGEEGASIVIAVLASAVVLILGTTAVALSLHNSTQSGNDRRRVQAIEAAEAGIDYFYSYLQSTGGSQPTCGPTVQTVNSVPSSTFSVSAVYYNSTGGQLSCVSGALPAGVTPSYVKLTSLGKVSGSAPARAMESYAKLTVTQGSTFDNSSALMAQGDISFTANAQIGGSQYNDSDIYTNGNVSFAANSTLYGNVYAQGNVTIGSNSDVKKNVWANGSVALVGSARVRGSVTSSTSSITMNGGSHVYLDARAGTTVSNTGTVDGFKTQYAPQGPPPVRSYPGFTWVQSDWTNAGYTVHPYTDCTTPLNSSNLGNWWGAAAGTSHVIYITGGCTLTFNTTTFPSGVSVKGNLAIVSYGSIVMSQNLRFTPVGGPWNVFFFVLSTTPGCEFRTDANSGVDPGLSTMVYTTSTCAATLWSNSSIAQGQIIAGSMNFKHTVSFAFQRLTIPGTGVGGFKQDVSYKRECKLNTAQSGCA